MKKINKKSKYSGFTLLESLIVLLVCTVFTLLPILSLADYQQVIENEQFIESFEKNLLYTQQMAIVMNKDTQIIFNEQTQVFHYIIEESKEIILKEVPTQIKAKGPSKIVFKQGSGNNGNLSKYTFENQLKKQVIEFQFQLGSGRYVKKINKI